MEAKIMTLERSCREAHFPAGNEIVAVCWSCDIEEKKIIQDGVSYKADVYVKKRESYIDFIGLREDHNGEVYEREETPVDGGMRVDFAEKIMNELNIAIEYIKEKQCTPEIK